MQQNVLKQKLRAKRICAAIAKGAFLLVLFLRNRVHEARPPAYGAD